MSALTVERGQFEADGIPIGWINGIRKSSTHIISFFSFRLRGYISLSMNKFDLKNSFYIQTYERTIPIPIEEVRVTHVLLYVYVYIHIFIHLLICLKK